MTCIFKSDNRFSGCCDDIVIAILHNQKRIFSRPQLWLDCRICLVSCSGRSTIHPQPSLLVRKRDRNCRHPISLCLVFVLVILSFVFFLLYYDKRMIIHKLLPRFAVNNMSYTECNMVVDYNRVELRMGCMVFSRKHVRACVIYGHYTLYIACSCASINLGLYI